MAEQDHPDRPRLQRMLDEFFQRMIEEFDEYEDLDAVRDIAIDDAMLCAIMTFHDPDSGKSIEQPIMVSTSNRLYVQSGILSQCVAFHKKWNIFDIDEEEDDEEE